MNIESKIDRITDAFIVLAYITIIVLKAVNIIVISWWWIFSPFILVFGAGVIFATIIIIGMFINWIRRKIKK